jgi:outer membrane protein insertion porin family
VNLLEAKPHQMTGAVGYDSDAGCSAEARWTHRNFAGAGRTLTLSAVARTGWLALAENPDIRYRAAVSLLQPYVFHRRMSGVISPFVEERDDATDHSLEYGSNFTLILRTGTMRSVSLDYRLSRRRIYEYRLEDVTGGDVDLLTLLSYASQGFLDSLGTTLNNSRLTLSGRVGSLDHPANPREGWMFRPTVQVTAPREATSTEYWRLDGTLYGFLPLRRVGVLTGRIGGGRLLPFGKSLPSPDEGPAVKLLQMRDVLETAGGSEDVRGWGYRMLGPKFPDIRFGQDGDTTTTHVEGYVPLGALQQATFSVDLRMAMPGMGPKFGSRLFLDGGRVWTGDPTFDTGTDPYGQKDWFYSAGAGLDLITPVGPIRLSLAYKLNPSITDLVDAGDLLAATRTGQPFEDLPRHESRRWQFHFAIGTGL